MEAVILKNEQSCEKLTDRAETCWPCLPEPDLHTARLLKQIFKRIELLRIVRPRKKMKNVCPIHTIII